MNNLPRTEIEAAVDLYRTPDAACLVITTIKDRSGNEVHRLVSDPLDDENANARIGSQLLFLEKLGIISDPSDEARELLRWWDTDRYTLVYHRHHSVETDDFPTLERAFGAAEAMSDYGSGAPDEIQEFGSGRTLYKCRIGGWDRVASDVPLPDEFKLEL